MVRIHHVSIPYRSGREADARAFYGQLLGLEEIPPPSALEGVIWYRLGDTELHLFAQAEDDGELQRHLCFEVADLPAMRDALGKAGYEAHGAIPIPGRPRFFVFDPFGNRLEFTRLLGDYRAAQTARSTSRSAS
jgi:catechol 2,3-dioxygenase-like lactoylglutathione lyase family enzyme